MKLQVDIHSPAQFMTAIISDFGSATDASSMHTSALLVGDFGIDGFMSNVVYKLLDVLPLEHSSYRPLFDILATFVRELVRKMTNWKKVSRCRLSAGTNTKFTNPRVMGNKRGKGML